MAQLIRAIRKAALDLVAGTAVVVALAASVAMLFTVVHIIAPRSALAQFGAAQYEYFATRVARTITAVQTFDDGALVAKGPDAITLKASDAGEPWRLMSGDSPATPGWFGDLEARAVVPLDISGPKKTGSAGDPDARSSIGCAQGTNPADNALTLGKLDVCLPDFGLDWGPLEETRTDAYIKMTAPDSYFSAPNYFIRDPLSQEIGIGIGAESGTLLLQNQTSAAVGRWLEDARMARRHAYQSNLLVVLRMDDQIQGQVVNYLPVFEKYGVRGIYGVNVNDDAPTNVWAWMQEYVDAGWEIFDHLPSASQHTTGAAGGTAIDSGALVDLMNETQADIDANAEQRVNVNVFTYPYGENGALTDGINVEDVVSMFYDVGLDSGSGINLYPQYAPFIMTSAFNGSCTPDCLARYLEDARACGSEPGRPCLLSLGWHSEPTAAEIESIVVALLAEGAEFVTATEAAAAVVPRSYVKNLWRNSRMTPNTAFPGNRPYLITESMTPNSTLVYGDGVAGDSCVSVTDTDGGNNAIYDAIPGIDLWEWEVPDSVPQYNVTQVMMLVDVTTTGVTGTGARISLIGAGTTSSSYMTGTNHGVLKVTGVVPTASLTPTVEALRAELEVDGVTAGTVKFCRPTVRIQYPGYTP